MSIEEYIARLQAIAAEHPGKPVRAWYPGEDGGTVPPAVFDAVPEWSERDQVVYADASVEIS